MAATAAELDYLVRVYQAAVARTAAATEAVVEQAWRAMPGLSERDVVRFLERAGAGVRAGQDAGARLGATFIDTYVAAATGETTPVSPVDIDDALGQVRYGGARDRRYLDIIERSRQAADAGADDAIELGRAALGQMADQDVTLSVRAGSSAAIERHPQLGPDTRYKRTPEPTACQFCRVAAEQLYRRFDLLPIHGHCHCVTVPVVGRTSSP
jgi:hypothetical protein